MARKIKPSHWVLLGSVAVGAVVGGGAWLLWPGAVWWAYVSGALFVGVMLFPQLSEHFANVALMDRDRD